MEQCSFFIRKLKFYNIVSLLKVAKILFKCGKNMAQKYNLYHWDNSRIKNCLIITWCIFRNNVYLVFDNNKAVATFQTRIIGNSFLFQKLATLPSYEGNGVGTYCLCEIEKLAKNYGCAEIIAEVYDKSEHAKTFYLHRGFIIDGTLKTLKYNELKLKKIVD